MAWPADRPTTSAPRRPVAIHTAAETKYPRKRRANHHQSAPEDARRAPWPPSPAAPLPSATRPPASLPPPRRSGASPAATTGGGCRRQQHATAGLRGTERPVVTLPGWNGWPGGRPCSASSSPPWRRRRSLRRMLRRPRAPVRQPPRSCGLAPRLRSANVFLFIQCVLAKRCLFLQSCRPLIRVAGGLHHVRG